jgi:mono/diheme cytochrome c family protein
MKAVFSIVFSLLAAATVHAQDGEALWTANCTPCHGASGRGDTKMGQTLGAANLTDPKKQASFTDAQATAAIKDGVKKDGAITMPAFGGNFSDEDIKALVAYVRTLKQ